MEQVIGRLHAVVRPGPQCVGAEYWMRAQPADTGFPFHFDRDEAIRAWVSSPRLASILYLSNVGGPTLILDALPSDAAAPTRGIAILPRRGRYVMFPGTLLHGVQAGDPSRWPRVALFVNWWDQKPAALNDRASFALRTRRRRTLKPADEGVGTVSERASGHSSNPRHVVARRHMPVETLQLIADDLHAERAISEWAWQQQGRSLPTACS